MEPLFQELEDLEKGRLCTLGNAPSDCQIPSIIHIDGLAGHEGLLH